MTTNHDDLQSLSEQAKALLADEDELERLEQQNQTREQRAQLMELQAKNLFQQRVKAMTRGDQRLREISTEIKEIKSRADYGDAQRVLDGIQESSGMKDLSRERKEIKADIAATVENDQEIQYLREQVDDLREKLDQATERITSLRLRNRAASRNIVEQAALIVQLPLL